MTGEALAALAADIKAHGLREPITEHEGLTLDGRNRHRACVLAEVEPRFEEFQGEDPVSFVISKNIHRRHLNESQLGMVMARMAQLPAGRPKKWPRGHFLSAGEKARLLNISKRTGQRAKAVLEKGLPAIVARVDRGGLSVKVAAQVAELGLEEQAALADAPEARLRNAAKAVARSKREKALATSTEAASQAIGSSLYSVMVADPPWRFEPYSRETGLDRAADNHYPTMQAAEICEIQPPAAGDCILFLWATVPMLEQALQVMQRWGFSYRSQFVWVKDRAGTGYWNRNKHELLLVGTRGRVPAPAPGDQHESVVPAQVGWHSEKPVEFFEMIQAMFPTARRLEMFARRQRLGWDTWGNEVTGDAPPPEPGPGRLEPVAAGRAP